MDTIKIVNEIKPDPESGRKGEGCFFRTKDGAISFYYACVMGNTVKDYDPAKQVVIRSYDDGETWSDPVDFMVPGSVPGLVQLVCPSCLRMLNGDMGIFLCGRTDVPMVNGKVLCLSKDEGVSCYKIIDCIPSCYSGQFGLNNDRAVRLSSGRIILPLSIHPGTRKEQTGSVKPRASRFTSGHVIYSDDDGRSWKSSSDLIMPPFTDTTKGVQEGGIIEIKPGILKSYWRTDVGNQYTSLSFDDGDHWTVPARSRFTAPWSPMEIERNPFTGKLYAFWNPIPLYNGRKFDYYNWGRSPFVYAEISDDANIITGEIKTIENDPERGYAYPSVLFLNEKQFLISYCCGGLEERSCLAKTRIAKITMD